MFRVLTLGVESGRPFSGQIGLLLGISLTVLGKGRKDKSGDFTVGADLTKSQIKILTDSLSGVVQPEIQRDGMN